MLPVLPNRRHETIEGEGRTMQNVKTIKRQLNKSLDHLERTLEIAVHDMRLELTEARSSVERLDEDGEAGE